MARRTLKRLISQLVMTMDRTKRNQYARTSWKNLQERDPVRAKAYRLRMSLHTMKVADAPNIPAINRMIRKPMDCVYCSRTMAFREISIDHIKSRYDGGLGTMSNIQFICIGCNQLKGLLSDDEFKLLRSVLISNGVMDIFSRRIEPHMKFFKRRMRLVA